MFKKAFLIENDLRRLEHSLGFYTDVIFPQGYPANQIEHFKFTSNSRKTDSEIESFIKNRWKEIEEKSQFKAFDAPRARYEGYILSHGDALTVLWSEGKYSDHAVLRETILSQDYQAELFTINGILLTSDGKFPIAVRNPKQTDQGKIKLVAPAGFINLKHDGKKIETVKEADDRGLWGKLEIESIYDAATRELSEELEHKDSTKRIEYVPNGVRLLGIVYNSKKNFDWENAVLIPTSVTSDKIKLKGAEHVELEWTNSDLDTLKTTLFELAKYPDSNSGHLRGDVALLAAYLNGMDKYKELLLDVLKEVSIYNKHGN